MNKVYHGLASSNGIESFLLDETSTVNQSTELGSRFGDIIFGHEENETMTDANKQMLGMMVMTARANPQRQNVVYRATVTPELAEVIEDMMSTGQQVAALRLLKAGAEEIALAKMPGAERMWKLIPNPDLDPFS